MDNVVWMIQCPLAVYAVGEETVGHELVKSVMDLSAGNQHGWSERRDAGGESARRQMGQMQGRQRHASASELAGDNSRWGKRAGWAVLGAKRILS